jgi:hypothetical protein
MQVPELTIPKVTTEMTGGTSMTPAPVITVGEEDVEMAEVM